MSGPDPRRTIGVPLMALVVLVVAAAPAPAHAMLTGSQPEEDDAVEEPLDAVVLEFSEDVTLPDVDVTDPDGESVVDGEPEEHGDEIEQPLADLSVEGTYTVSWRVVSADDHPIEGEFTFEYAGPLAEEEPAPEPEEQPGPDGDEPADDEPVGDGPVDEEPAEDEPADDEELAVEPTAETGSGLPMAAIAVIVLLGVAAAAAFALRGRGGTAASD